jgi:hypothetical protein
VRDLAPARRRVWLVAVLVSAGVLVALRLGQDVRAVAAVAAPLDTVLDARAGRAVAGVLTALLATGLSVRCGGRPLVPCLTAVVGAAVAVVTGDDLLLAAMAVVTGSVGAVLAVMVTTPAATFRRATREVLLAVLLAAITALGVAGWTAPLSVARYDYVVLGLALVGAVAVVYSLGAGLHGLGARGTLVAAAAVLVLAFALAYGEALAHWGSPGLIEWADRIQAGTRARLHAVPHPMEVLLGVPALVWGVFMRARRRQGWWVTAFGTVLTAPLASRLVDDVPLATTLLAEGYSLVLGLALGYLVIRVDQSVTGSRGRRARRDEEAAAHRPEPGRSEPLH